MGFMSPAPLWGVVHIRIPMTWPLVSVVVVVVVVIMVAARIFVELIPNNAVKHKI